MTPFKQKLLKQCFIVEKNIELLSEEIEKIKPFITNDCLMDKFILSGDINILEKKMLKNLSKLIQIEKKLNMNG